LEKLKAADFALFASHWWPNSDFQELRILAFLSIWLFVWDDEIDESTGSLTNDYDASVEFRRQTVIFLEQCLDLDPYTPRLVPSSSIIKSFDVIGDAIREVYDISMCLCPDVEGRTADDVNRSPANIHGGDDFLHGNVGC
jgi:hypothetical protein